MILNVVLLVAVAVTGFLVLGALSALARLGWRLDQLEATTPSKVGRNGLSVGTKAPEFTLPNVAGTETSLRDFAGRQVLLVFSQPNCGPCHDVVPDLNSLHKKGPVEVVTVCKGDATAVRQWAGEVGARFPVLGQDNWNLSKKYEVFATPFAFLLDGAGVIRAKGIAGKGEHLRFLLESAREGARSVTVDSTESRRETPAGMAGLKSL